MSIGTIIVDVLILVMLIATVYTSYKKGLLLTLYKIVSIFLAIWIAWAINPIVKNTLIEKTSIEDYINENITEGVTRSISNSLFTGEATEDNEDAVSNLNVPNFFKSYLAKKASEDKSEAGLASFISSKLTDICMTIISFLLVVVLVVLILSLLKGILEIISEIPIIESINKIAGMIFGVMLAAVKIWIIFLIIGLFINATKGGVVYTSINDSILGGWFYNHNLISYIILKFLG